MTTDLEARVAKGAALLDSQMPGWRRVLKAKLDGDQTLQMWSCTSCVLGLLTGHFQTGCALLAEAAHAPPSAYGFTTVLLESAAAQEWRDLGHAWIAEIYADVPVETPDLAIEAGVI